MEYTAGHLEYAVSVFYNCEASERAQAHEWLTTAQRCPEAWSFVWELLQCHKGTEVQFFAATTLHTKLLRCWDEVPADNREELKNKILEAILAFCNGPKIVLNRLCISLAAYIMQQGAEELASTLRPLSGPENVSVLLEILTVIPEEFNSMTMGAALRSRTRSALQQASPAVLDDMLRHLQSAGQDVPLTDATIQTWCKAASCAASWLALGGEGGVEANWNGRDEDAGSSSLPDCLPLCQALLRVVHTIITAPGTISESGLEACEAALGAVRAAAASPPPAPPPAALQVARMLTDLTRPLLVQDAGHDSHSEDLLAALFTCAVAIGECHTRALVNAAEREAETGDAAARELLELLLACQSAPGFYPVQETHSSLTFGFWYMLQDEVVYLNVTSLNVLFLRLFDVLIEKSRAPDESSLASDDAELLRCYRQDIADTVPKYVSTPGGNKAIDLLALALLHKCGVQSAISLLCRVCRKNGRKREKAICAPLLCDGAKRSKMSCWGVLRGACWEAVEAAWRRCDTDAAREATLHVFLALSDAAPMKNDAPPEIARMLEHAATAATTSTDTRLVHTSLECLGAYAMWLGSLEGEGGALARAALQAAGACLPRAPARAALALRKLSSECHQHAAPLAEQIVQAALTASGRYEGWVSRQLLGAAGAALSTAPQPAALTLLSKLADSLYNDLKTEAEEAERLGARSASRGAAEAAAALLASLPEQRVLAATLLCRLLPILPPLTSHPQHVPVVFQLLKQALQVLMEDCLPVMDQLSQLALQALHTAPCPIGIDVIRLMVLMLGNEWSGSAGLLRACVEVCVRACRAADLASVADVAEGLFVALTSIAKKKPQYLDFLGDFLPQTVELGCACVPLWEAGAARSACSWLAALAAVRPHEMRAHAPHLAAVAVRCIGGATPRNQVEPLADLLLALNRAPWSEADRAAAGDLAAWLRHALQPAGFPSPHASDKHKQKFIAAVLKNKRSRRRVLETVQEFSLVCRGLIGTEYARQTLASRQLVA